MLIISDRIKKLDQIFLESIITNGIEENLHLDYKEAISEYNAEIAKDISSFANEDGGNIIYGIREVKNKPTEIIPINEKGVRERIDQISRTGIDPPLDIRIFPVDVDVKGNKGQVFIVYIPKKYPVLHQAKKNKIYYKRTEFTSSRMSNNEIKRAFNLAYKLDQKIEQYREERTEKIISHKVLKTVANSTMIILHMIPINAFGATVSQDLQRRTEIFKKYFNPIECRGTPNIRMTYDGIIYWFENEKTNTMTYVELFNNGIVEAVDGLLIDTIESEGKELRMRYLEFRLINIVQQYFKGLKELNVQLPIYLFMTFVGVKGYNIPLTIYKLQQRESEKIDRNELILPGVKLNHDDDEIDKLLKPIFDSIWRACGMHYSLDFDDNGKFKKD